MIFRDDLRKRLWPADTFVDFDHSLNTAIRRLRDALGDSAENPRVVETVATARLPVSGAGRWNPNKWRRSRGRSARRHSTAFQTRASLLAGGRGHRHRASASRTEARAVARTAASFADADFTAHRNPADDRVRAAISHDGKYLAFSDETGFYLRQIDTGETHPMVLPQGLFAAAVSWFSDSVHMVVALTDRPGIKPLGGNARKLCNDGRAPAISPDGKDVAFITGNKMQSQLWLAGADGSQPHKLAGEQGDFFGALAWSPDGAWIAYTGARFAYAHGVDGGIEVLPVKN